MRTQLLWKETLNAQEVRTNSENCYINLPATDHPRSDQGKAVVADDGTHVLLQCCLEQSFSAKSVGKVKGVNSRMECVNKCFSDEHEHCDRYVRTTVTFNLSFARHI